MSVIKLTALAASGNAHTNICCLHTHTHFHAHSVSHVSQASQDQKLDCALDLMRRLPPQQIEKNLSDLIDLVRLYVYVCVCVNQGF